MHETRARTATHAHSMIGGQTGVSPVGYNCAALPDMLHLDWNAPSHTHTHPPCVRRRTLMECPSICLLCQTQQHHNLHLLLSLTSTRSYTAHATTRRLVRAKTPPPTTRTTHASPPRSVRTTQTISHAGPRRQRFSWGKWISGKIEKFASPTWHSLPTKDAQV